MKERIHALLDICMLAQEKGHDIHFESTHNGISVIHFVPSDKTKTGLEIAEWIVIKPNIDDADERFNDAERYLKELMSDVCTGQL